MRMKKQVFFDDEEYPEIEIDAPLLTQNGGHTKNARPGDLPEADHETIQARRPLL